MNDRITAGAAALTGSLVLGTALVRWAVSPAPQRGRHRGLRVRAVLDDASLDKLLGPWPEKPYGAVARPGWGDCPVCDRTTAGVLTEDGGWRCGECLQPVPAGGVS